MVITSEPQWSRLRNRATPAALGNNGHQDAERKEKSREGVFDDEPSETLADADGSTGGVRHLEAEQSLADGRLSRSSLLLTKQYA